MREKKREILLKSLELFMKKGYDGVSISDISSCVDLTKPALYYYFADKQAIFHEAVEFMFKEIVSRLERISDDLSPCDKFRLVLEALTNHKGVTFSPEYEIKLNTYYLLDGSKKFPDTRKISAHYSKIVTTHINNILVEGRKIGAIRSDISISNLSNFIGIFIQGYNSINAIGLYKDQDEGFNASFETLCQCILEPSKK